MRRIESLSEQLSDGRAPLVVKIGSSLLIDAEGAPREAWMRELAAKLASRPGPVVMVSSGAIGLGRRALGMAGRPNTLAEAQACAAVGQIQLARLWAKIWAGYDKIAAQVLLTLGDLEERGRYLNARNTLETLLERGAVPIINENDTVATGEIRFGDNDRLSARVAQLIGAGLLVLLSDVEGLYDADPRHHGDARLMSEVDRIDASIEALAGAAEATGFGTGGMVSKLAAARIATESGCPVLLIGGSSDQEPIQRYLDTGRGTLFAARQRARLARKQWLSGLQRHLGELHVDAGAARALKSGASLLARGVDGVKGEFSRGDLVRLCAPDGPLGQGLAGYASRELVQIAGRHSEEFESILGYAGRGPVIHRDDLVLF